MKLSDLIILLDPQKNKDVLYTEECFPDLVRINEKWHVEQEKIKRELLHLKDEHNISDKGLDAIDKFIKKHQKFFSIHYLRKKRKETNQKFPIVSIVDGAYIQFEYAIKTALFIAQRKNRNLHQLPQITFRLNMDGTLIGNKHIVAISVNCVEGGRDCQSPKNLVPVGLFEFPKESCELYRKILPKSFLDSLSNVKYVRLNKKDIPIKLKLGGDFMNAVYVFGLAGVQSNFPCIFCTQHKSKLEQPDTTSYFDVQKGARTLEEQKLCLKKTEKNSKGYKCEPLFGDLFEFSDYIMDTLHMKLRVYDVFMTDILHYTSKRERYGKEHDLAMERKVDILNEHAKKRIGKRVFFAYDSKEQLGTDYDFITSGSNDSSSDGQEEDENENDESWFNLSGRKIVTAARFSSFKRIKKS
ncbi:unnamed protein product [Didymodactylos carnosus]|uniref:Uncharacterized protein n=1 Tax=Didymodactylos carnosus TaxID=1234261 RepID=A0A814MNS1_9BILA|nr:unnamed protein product [Didymodactylos carnosus]CAF3846566.1 unnamed protein product [Didymodactylos carnosus]